MNLSVPNVGVAAYGCNDWLSVVSSDGRPTGPCKRPCMGRPHILGVTCLSRFPNNAGNVLLDEYVTQYHEPVRFDYKLAFAFLRFVAPIFLWNQTVPGITRALPKHGALVSSGSA